MGMGYRRDAGEFAKGGQQVSKVDVAGGAAAGHDARALDDHRHAPGVLVEVLFSLQAVASDGHAVVGGVEDVGVVKFARFCEFREDAAELDVDVFLMAGGRMALAPSGAAPGRFHGINRLACSCAWF